MFNTIDHSKLSRQSGDPYLAARITKEASKQTYYTIRFLVDRDRVQDAYRAYAYFRWLDDQLDCNSATKPEKAALIKHQQALLDAGYQGNPQDNVSIEELMLVDLIRNDNEEHSGLQIYLRNMMTLLSFDVERNGRVISNAEMGEYIHLLSSSVTEAIIYFIGHRNPPPCSEIRYHAVCGAHVAHMLRDVFEDIAAGYYNFPPELSNGGQISVKEVHDLPFRKWVYSRVKLARRYFQTGKKYVTQVKNLRCRLACLAYIARFEWVLRMIEKDGYCLRPDYMERKSLRAGLWMVWRVLSSLVNLPWSKSESSKPMALSD